jgi:hypothetical protein
VKAKGLKYTSTGLKLHSAKKGKCKNLRLAFVLDTELSSSLPFRLSFQIGRLFLTVTGTVAQKGYVNISRIRGSLIMNYRSGRPLIKDPAGSGYRLSLFCDH